MSLLAYAKQWLRGWQKKLILGKQMQQVPLNCYIVIVLLLLTLNTALPNECNPYNPSLKIIRFCFVHYDEIPICSH